MRCLGSSPLGGFVAGVASESSVGTSALLRGRRHLKDVLRLRMTYLGHSTYWNHQMALSICAKGFENECRQSLSFLAFQFPKT